MWFQIVIYIYGLRLRIVFKDTFYGSGLWIRFKDCLRIRFRDKNISG